MVALADYSIVIGLVVCAAVSYKCFPVSLFSAHPLGMSLGVLVFSNMAISSIRGRHGAKDAATRKSFIIGHVIFIVLTMLSVGIGFGAIYYNKVKIGKEHFTSTHGQVGLAAFVLMFLNTLHGSLNTLSSCKVQWFWSSFIHRSTGILAYITSGVAVVYGLYSGWGMNKFGERIVPILAGLAVLSTLLTVLGGLTAKPSSTKAE
jgi:cytochrome b-561 domain-containing protein 2